MTRSSRSSHIIKPVAAFVVLMLIGAALGSASVAAIAQLLGGSMPWIAVLYAIFIAVFVAFVAMPESRRSMAAYVVFCIIFGVAAGAFEVQYIQKYTSLHHALEAPEMASHC